MNFNNLKKLLPKKSVLNKNKWLIFAIVLCVCGLYWYSKKNKENFEKYDAGYTNLTNNVELNRNLYTDENVQVKDISEIKNTNDMGLLTFTRAIRNIYLKGLKKGCILNKNWLNGSDPNTGVNNPGAINTSEFNDFFLGDKSDNGVWVLGDENMFENSVNCTIYNEGFKAVVVDGGYKDIKSNLETNNKDKNLFSETDYLTNSMNETVTVFVAEGCAASDDFLNKIWTQELKEYLLENYPAVSLNVEKCEVLEEGKDGRLKDSMCNLSGLFNTKDKESTLAYPLIQYSILFQTKNLGEDKYALIQNNFDPTKKYDSTQEFEEVDTTNYHKTIYSANKIKKWLLEASGGG